MSPFETAYFEPVEEDRLELVGQLSLSEPQLEKKTGKVQFDDQVEIRYLSNEDITQSLIHRSDIWYMKSDLIAMRKTDREALLVALKSLTSNAIGARQPTVGQVAPPPPPPGPPPGLPPSPPTQSANPSEPFYFRGMEVILYKRERDECRRRAAEAVLNAQQRLRNRANITTLEPTPATEAQQQIADAYRLLTRNVADEAYLRGLGDAREAREVFQRSLLFPSRDTSSSKTSSPKPQAREPVSSPKMLKGNKSQLQDRENISQDAQPSSTPIRDAVSWKMILQRNSQLRSSETTPYQMTCGYQADSSDAAPQQAWKCCTYGGN